MVDVHHFAGWIGGALVGLFTVGLLWITGRHLGASTGYGNLCGLVSRQPFFRSGEYADPAGWRLWFTLGLPLGGLAGALVTPGYSFEAWAGFSMGEMYDSVMPEAAWAKGLVVLLGGTLIGYGARVAGGCMSGHSIMGLSLLNPPSLLASAGFFAGGIVSVQLLFRALS